MLFCHRRISKVLTLTINPAWFFGILRFRADIWHLIDTIAWFWCRVTCEGLFPKSFNYRPYSNFCPDFNNKCLLISFQLPLLIDTIGWRFMSSTILSAFHDCYMCECLFIPFCLLLMLSLKSFSILQSQFLNFEVSFELISNKIEFSFCYHYIFEVSF